MCMGCYEELGKPIEFTDTTMEAVEAIRDLYEYSIVGGWAHIVTDDWNLEDEHIEHCFKWMNDPENPTHDDEREVTEKVLTLLKNMTVPQRATVLAICDGFTEPPEDK